MSDFEIEDVIEKVRKNRKIFTSEADLQLEVAFAIKELYDDVSVYREYVPDIEDLSHLSKKEKDELSNMHTDILVVTNDNEWIPIELKYKTRKIYYKDNKTGCVFNLKEHGAHDCGCYDYFKDIYRIEQIGKNFEQFCKGYTIFITNDPLYQNGPSSSKVNYVNFALGGKKAGINPPKKYKWKKGVPSKDRKLVLNFDGTYSFEWKEFFTFDREDKSINHKKTSLNALSFLILVNKVEKGSLNCYFKSK